jgi:Kdo2-lipid IVA lauroyltransferase/acyltransferase
VVLAYTIREPDNKHGVYIVKELPCDLKEGEDQSLIDVTQSYCDELETLVRRYPEQWMWLHRRWKKFVVQ